MKKILVVFISALILMPIVKSSTTSASSYILMDQNTGRVLLSKDKDSQRLIASITKIMTCILALESGKSEEVVTVDENATSAYGSGIYIEVGEEIKLKDLLYGLMLRSGNDAASMIASYVSGSIEEFVKLMNNKAKELGMKNTIFYTPSGLPTPHGNTSTVYDMAILTKYAMQNKEYRKIVSTKKLDNIEQAIIKAKSSIEEGELPDALQEIETTIFFVEHVKQREKLSLKNIF